MNIFENIDCKFLKDVLEIKHVDSVFISSWDSIYICSKDGYCKSNVYFKDIYIYSNVVEKIVNTITKKSDEFLIVDNIKVYLHKWSDENYWITLVKM